ncbi:MAG: type II toxin-antitoxin system RelE/ParE family toxin [Pseudomonadota bacterium]
MSLTIKFERVARDDVIAACAWYEERRRGLGIDLMMEIDRCVSLAAAHPSACEIVHKDIRRMVTRRFPYLIYFRTEPKQLRVLAVFHARRDPKRLHGRV